ncbi:NACHT, LRR and PYD domains-containing protein 3-like isoform X6 [Xyrauchen texanus]|uniref:NACHT, LRR and PYD domains-containing protein 3-like isoform X5 n=1 Tax=Xyrauchen texanus TaxID=154827 RepID=UPI002241F52F|nr:NACHT, LRR and PYD domains-containing protein 3-like isoform X5 [Xyrauchen texanus]XP_051992123.1 NACHT, LRR and PYD domains-containing protein 3-like isoform X5 [Xyrauchen texanus]XP_051992124.1 NACHT, LRR and PYD domains-containing protein 3-like isoform X5 [Xyrauchen texanus]XP_051992125.1 NACHT, LRR and PYD domains-containing protein 3-like isoform X5 [Xyrauchen texanus]XP_051992127.1 NACHT, LRR and PYD domains-containing protein 3-like isoform X6 [Xyrauchen texanus]XP_051992128.1 NACHT
MDSTKDLSGQTDTGKVKSVIHGESPESSCVSMKSDGSMNQPLHFSSRESLINFRNKQDESESTAGKVPLDSIYEELEHKIISLMKKELKNIKRLLISDSPACSEREEEDDEGQSRVREGFLKITLHVLKKMKQTDLANTLQTKLISVHHQKLKTKLKEKFQRITEGMSNQSSSTLVNEIYTELYITEGGSAEINNEHEVRQIETASRRADTQETPIKCNDIFKALPGQDKAIRTVLTKGVAGIGKTVSVQNFIVDWTEGKANQDVHFIFPLPFRELNLMKHKNISLMNLLHQFFTDTKELRSTFLDDYKVIFIFDGLDECRLPLDFQNNDILCDVTESASVDVLLTNLIKGNLLPSALLWITSRPAAANQIPPECVDQLTDVRGFNDPQKDEYFRKRIKDKRLANRIITHMKSSRSLYIMCHIPVFCWISATVLQRLLSEAVSAEIPKTLTQMFTHFLIFQSKLKSQKYDGKCEVDLQQARKRILSLGKLAFQQLEKGNLIFYEEDLRECGIDVREASVYSGVCTQIFREEFGLHLGKVFSFVHLSIQEFLAALYAFISFSQQKSGLFSKFRSSMSDLLKSEVDKALQSENGHLDLFIRFLLGLSLKSNQTILRDLLTQTGSSSDNKQEIVKYIKMKIRENPSPEKSINLFHCLNELIDHSLVQEVQTYVNRRDINRLSGVSLSPAQWSALVFVLLNSEEELDQFNLRKYDPSDECLLRLLPVIKASRKADLMGCDLTEQSCSALASVLSSNSSSLRELDLSNNDLQDSGVKLLSDALKSPHCTLEILRFAACRFNDQCCETLSSVLQSSKSLRELDLSNNDLQDSGVKLLSDALKSPHCTLEILRCAACRFTDQCCESLSSVLQSSKSLRELDLSNNDLQDSGVKLLSDALKSSHCKLEILRLSGCMVTEEGCCSVASALRSNLSRLKELDLSYNHPGESGVRLLSERLNDPNCTLDKLNVDHGGEFRITAGPRKYVCDLTLDSNTAHTELILSEGNRKVTRVRERQSYPDHPERFDVYHQVLCRESLTGRCYWETQWSGDAADISVSYKEISRKGESRDCVFGLNVNSWSLWCSNNTFTVCHNNNSTDIRPPSHDCKRVGVYVDCPAGTLSFYSVSDTHTLTHLHTLITTFTRPLYAGFIVYPDSSVCVCEMDHQRHTHTTG